MSDRSCREGSNLSSSTCSAEHNLSQLFQLFRPDYAFRKGHRKYRKAVTRNQPIAKPPTSPPIPPQIPPEPSDETPMPSPAITELFL